MRSEAKFTICSSEVSAVAGGIQEHLKFEDYSKKCLVSMILSILLFAASRIHSIHEACQRLRDAPSDETLRKVLRATLPGTKELHRRVNASLANRLPQCFFKRGQLVAMDLTEISLDGQSQRDPGKSAAANRRAARRIFMFTRRLTCAKKAIASPWPRCEF